MTQANGGVFGGPNPQSVGANLGLGDLTTGIHLLWTSGTAAGNGTGISGESGTVYTLTQPSAHPKVTAEWIPSHVSANGSGSCLELTTSVSTNCVSHVIGPGATSLKYISLGQRSNVQNVYCCSADGSNQSCVDMGFTIVDGTDYKMVMDYSNPNLLRCTVNGTTVTKSTNLPTGADLWGLRVFCLTSGTGSPASCSIKIGSVCVEYD
jgi:hypothetical protein